MKPGVSVAIAAVLFAGAAHAQGPSAWTVDKAGSKIAFEASFSGMAVKGAFADWDAQISFDPADLGHAQVRVAVDTGSVTTGEEAQDESLVGGDWFDPTVFPKAVFVSRSFKALGGDRYEAQGDLTLRDVTRPVTLPFALKISGDIAAMQGALTLDRTSFGVGRGQWADTGSVPAQVKVTVTVAAHKQR